MNAFPNRHDGPPKGAWNPAQPYCGLGSRDGQTFKFAVKTADGTVHRFLLTRAGAQWLTESGQAALADHVARPGVQSFTSSDTLSSEGSPQEGQEE